MKKTLLFLALILCLSTYNGYTQIRVQEQSMWCWASCIQSALQQGYVFQSQAEIVARLTGWPQNRPANPTEIIAILNSYNFRAWSVNYPATPQQLYQTLLSGWKLIAFVNPTHNPQVGHFVMLQGISANGYVILSDPANGATYEQDLNSLYYAWNWGGSVVVGSP